MANKALADIFTEMAYMVGLEERPTSRFEVRAYENAALTLNTLQEDVASIYEKGGVKALMELPGIGKGLAEKIVEYLKTGKVRKYLLLKKEYPIDFNGLAGVEGLGPKKIVLLYQKLGIKNIRELKAAVAQHKIRELEGFGEKSEETIANGIAVVEAGHGRMLLGEALPVAEAIIAKILRSGLVTKAVVAGSARRMRETVGDLDILAISANGSRVMELFTGLDEVEGVVVKGPTKTTARLKIGITCDLRVIDSTDRNFGAALQYFTGGKEHNVAVRTIAIEKGYKLNEYGLFRGKRALPCGSEEEVYKTLGMDYMPPEMRENRGEIRLAQEHRLPRLVELSDIVGDLHTHTKETDGVNTIDEMADAAMKAGYSYFATTNHTKSLRVAHGMNESEFARFFKKVDMLNEKLDGKIRILKGAEVDILKDGSLDLERSLLKEMDCVVAGVHSFFKMDEKSMTDRVITAFDTGLVDILAHPTGRIINGREGYRIDLDKVAEAAERNSVAFEIDALPDRLDLNDTNIMKVSKYRVMFSIDTDSHATNHFAVMRYGVGTARRGWLEKNRILNTLDLAHLEKILGG
jgi:DNA polymerase (family 10)